MYCLFCGIKPCEDYQTDIILNFALYWLSNPQLFSVDQQDAQIVSLFFQDLGFKKPET